MSSVLSLLNRKIWGIRWVEIFGGVMVAAMVASIYVAKAAAGRETARIAEIDRQIDESGERVRLLRAEVARLEQPGRLEALSRQVGLGPVGVAQRSDEKQLGVLAAGERPATVPAAPVAAPPVVDAPDAVVVPEARPEPQAEGDL